MHSWQGEVILHFYEIEKGNGGTGDVGSFVLAVAAKGVISNYSHHHDMAGYISMVPTVLVYNDHCKHPPCSQVPGSLLMAGG